MPPGFLVPLSSHPPRPTIGWELTYIWQRRGGPRAARAQESQGPEQRQPHGRGAPGRTRAAGAGLCVEEQPRPCRTPAPLRAATRPRPTPSEAPPRLRLRPYRPAQPLSGSHRDQLGHHKARAFPPSCLRSVARLGAHCAGRFFRLTQSPIPAKHQPQERTSHFIKQESRQHPFIRHIQRRRCCRCGRMKRAPRGACTPGTAVACRPSTTGSTGPCSSAWGTRRTRASLVPDTPRSADASSGAGEGTGGTERPPGSGAVGRRGGLVNAKWAEQKGMSGHWAALNVLIPKTRQCYIGGSWSGQEEPWRVRVMQK